MATARSASQGEREAWLPLVVDCEVCETTHAVAIGDRRGCPFEGLQRTSLAPYRRPPIQPSDGNGSIAERLTGRLLR